MLDGSLKKKTLCKIHSDTNMTKIHLAGLEILSFSCFLLFVVMVDSKHPSGKSICKKKKKTTEIIASYKDPSYTKLVQIHSADHFHLFVIFSERSWWPCWIFAHI